jgi:hypothetical protein
MMSRNPKQHHPLFSRDLPNVTQSLEVQHPPEQPIQKLRKATQQEQASFGTQ